MSIGLACSECFHGENLARILKPGFDYEAQVMQDLMAGKPASPLSIHTSAGVTEFLDPFLEALEPHLPWSKDEMPAEDDWCVSLQLEGASAVWAGIDLLLQIRMLETGETERIKVAVAGTSYHGPPVTSFGSKSPLWTKQHQVKYPAPVAGEPIDEDLLIKHFSDFLDEHANDLGVILFEPQWGSSQAGLPWPKSLLKKYIEMAKERELKVLCDEIMCGLGRHGLQTLFVSEAWDLNPDCVTFGKAIGGGVYPIAGAITKYGRSALQYNLASVMQSHTYAGSSARALMAATEVLNELPSWFESIAKLGQEMDNIFSYLNKVGDGIIQCHGQGLMWGGLFTKDGSNADPVFRNRVVVAFKKHCATAGVLPYFVPVGGFMVSPVVDIDVGTIYEIGERLEEAIVATMDEVGWRPPMLESTEESVSEEESVSSTECVPVGKSILPSESMIEQIAAKADKKCNTVFHRTRSCTDCSDFVCSRIRTKFLKV